MDLPNTEQIKRLTEFIFANFKYDFREYAESSFSRRLVNLFTKYNISNVNECIQKITETPDFMEVFVIEITVNVTELFRDPSFWKSYYNFLDGYIHRKSNIKILHIACSSGEEVMSNQIVLNKLHATNEININGYDLDSNVLVNAKNQTISRNLMSEYQHNFNCVFPDDRAEKYFEFNGEKFTLKKEPNIKLNFTKHDITTEPIQEKYDIIFCRNLLIYFTPKMQSFVIDKIHKSLNTNGILCIGAKESLIWYDLYNQHFCAIDQKNKIYQKFSS